MTIHSSRRFIVDIRGTAPEFDLFDVPVVLEDGPHENVYFRIEGEPGFYFPSSVENIRAIFPEPLEKRRTPNNAGVGNE